MPEVEGVDKLISDVPRKKFGQFCKFGTSQFGWSHFGDDDVYFLRDEFGSLVFGDNKFGDVILLSGIYRTDNVTGKTLFYRQPYYITRNPRSDDQQTNRQKFADAMAAWEALTENEKEVYYNRVKKMRMYGWNLYVREYMLSN